MINIDETIFSTLTEKINDLRFLSKNDTNAFRKIITLVIIDEMLKWSQWFKEKDLSVQKWIYNLRNKYILCNSVFNIVLQDTTYVDQDGNIQVIHELQPYVNVNIPLTNFESERVWDLPDTTVEITVDIPIYNPEDEPDPWTPDPTCPVSLTYYGDGEAIPEDPNTGKPDVNINSLTTCEKMNIYINRSGKHKGEMYYLDPTTCKWELVKGQLSSKVKWDSITDAPKIYSGIEHTVNADTLLFNVHLNEAQYHDGTWTDPSHTSDVPVTDCSSDPDTNTDLKDIL